MSTQSTNDIIIASNISARNFSNTQNIRINIGTKFDSCKFALRGFRLICIVLPVLSDIVAALPLPAAVTVSCVHYAVLASDSLKLKVGA